MTLRELRRRWTPHRLDTDARRRWRDVAFRRFGIQRCHAPPILIRQPELAVESWLPFVVAHQIQRKPDFTFLQIGAFDGIGDDHLYQLVTKHRLRGILVEPQPDAFAQLEKLYGEQSQLTLLQAAISDREGTRDLYCQRGEASMAASFDRAHLLRHGIPDDEIIILSVACHTIESALRAGRLEHVDLVQIDAEGYDWPIIRSIDFAKLRPAIIRFEYRNLSTADADACVEFLAAQGYRFLIEPRDIIALRSPAEAASIGK
jgi:FkbM family methyltransferase